MLWWPVFRIDVISWQKAGIYITFILPFLWHQKRPFLSFWRQLRRNCWRGGWAFYEAMCCVYCPHLSKRSQMVTVNRKKTGIWHLKKFNMLNSILPLKILAWCHCAQKSHRIFNPVLHKYRKYWNYRKAGFISPKPRPLRKPKKSEGFSTLSYTVFLFFCF